MAANAAPAVIDVDSGEFDDDIELHGFHRRELIGIHQRRFEEEGIVYCGYSNNKGSEQRIQPLKPTRDPPAVKAESASRGPANFQPREVIDLVSDSDEEQASTGQSSKLESVHVNLQQASTSAQQVESPPLRTKREHPTEKSLLDPPKRYKAHPLPPTDISFNPLKRRHEADTPQPSRPSKVLRVEHIKTKETASRVDYDVPDDDSEAEYRTLFAAFDLDSAVNWKPSPKSSKISVSEEQELLMKIAALEVTSSPTSRALTVRRQGSVHRGWVQDTVPKNIEHPYGHKLLWTKLQNNYAQRCQPGGTSDIRETYTSIRALWLAERMTAASGSVIEITQSHKNIAVASVAAGGNRDDEPGPYNREGSLRVWSNGKCHILHGHESPWPDPLQSTKYFSTLDVAFDPTRPARLVSTGADDTVRIWDCPSTDENDVPRLVRTLSYECTMGTLSFKPKDSLLAMGGWNGSVCLYRPNRTHSKGDRLYVSPQSGAAHEMADMQWGSGKLSHVLFASSMSRGEKAWAGYHKAFDIRARKAVCEYSLGEAGEQIALDESGTSLVIASRSSKTEHSLNFYDARRMLPRSTSRIATTRFPENVNCLVYSSDGIYLAVARGDNATHVYDARYVEKGPLHVFVHDAQKMMAWRKRDFYGVLKAQWVQGEHSALGLVTGGADGCVRLWDVKRAADDPFNGVPLAECAEDVMDFALGDPCRREQALVVGESSGTVTILDITGRPSTGRYTTIL